MKSFDLRNFFRLNQIGHLRPQVSVAFGFEQLLLFSLKLVDFLLAFVLERLLNVFSGVNDILDALRANVLVQDFNLLPLRMNVE